MNQPTPFARRMSRVTASAIMELLKKTAQGEYISFASGLPDPSLFPAEKIALITQEILANDSRAALQYGAADGYAPLKAWVAERLRQRGLTEATPEHILITHGSQQALDLTARLFLDEGSPVLIESPSYLAAIQTFDSYEATYLPVPVDSEGMCVEEAISAIKRTTPRLAFTLPNFQNPSGVTQSLERRQKLAEALAEKRIPLLEDDAYHDLRHSGESLPSVTSLARNPYAVYTGTFSKIVAPGLRVGYLYAQPELVNRLTQLKQITDLHSNSLSQRIVYQFCERDWLNPQIEAQNRVYSSRRKALLAALAENLTGVAKWTEPEGGMFVLLSLPDSFNTKNLLVKAMERGVVYVPAESFYPNGGGESALRLNFVSATEEAIQRGIVVLTEVIHG
ncbi:MAG: PLP-dependent aminotransferase family protein [Armatimonadetes bacterium]|nr:PLP-dependent aminotransferase family protein [Armatimonadota bacterium]